jgi:hypothetical protein
VIDKADGVRIRKLNIEAGEVKEPAEFHYPPDGKASADLAFANDLQFFGDSLYVTRFDALAKFHGGDDWTGIVRIGPGPVVKSLARGVRGANGIAPGKPGTLVFSDYWQKRLRLFDTRNPELPPEFATAPLDIMPDNLTRDGSVLYIAGQRSAPLAFLNLFVLPFLPSPSAVYAIDVNKLGKDAQPELIWESGWQGRSESVAVPVPGGLALGRIRTRGILIAACRLHAR